MDMNKIEMLLMDHALDGTSSDVASLIEAYVEKDVEARVMLEEFRATASLAKRAMGAEEVALPAFPRSRLKAAWRGREIRRACSWGIGMAACVAVGFFAGNSSHRSERSPEMVAEVSTVRPEPAIPPMPERVGAVRDFWSVSRLQARVVESGNHNGGGASSKTDLMSLWPNAWQRSVRFGG